MATLPLISMLQFICLPPQTLHTLSSLGGVITNNNNNNYAGFTAIQVGVNFYNFTNDSVGSGHSSCTCLFIKLLPD